MVIEVKLSDIKTQLSSYRISDTNLVNWANELIHYITNELGFAPISAMDYIVNTTLNLPLKQDIPGDFLGMIRWEQNDIPYTGKAIRYREDGVFIFPYDNTTYTLLYLARIDDLTVADLNNDIPVDTMYHVYFLDYIKGKYYMDDGEGDEETSYGQVLINGVKNTISIMGDSKTFNQGPVIPHINLKWSRGIQKISDGDEDE